MKKCFTETVSRIMKICAIQVALALAFTSLCIAHASNAQVLETEISIDLENVPFEQALKEIGREGKVSFSYNHDSVADEEPVTLHVVKAKLKDVLDQILSGRDITYRLYNKNNLIALKKKSRDAERGESYSVPQENTVPEKKRVARVSGIVTDAQTTMPMPGVNVLVKGTTRGTTTDVEGAYGVDADPEDVLVFSFIGFAPAERRVGEQLRIDVAMNEDIRGLDEVVVNAGYYKTTKQQQTGSIVRIEGSEIQKQPVLNPLAALQAIVPGMQIIQNTGVPGGNFTVRIRGQNNIASGNDPLYIINGVPYTSATVSNTMTTNAILSAGTNPLNMLNPADIESIEVLKDADATSIYGSRGANGVVLITTKRGTAGRTAIDVNYYTGIGNVTRRIKMLNTKQFLEVRKEAMRNDNLLPMDPSRYTTYPDVFVWDTTRYTNWQKELIGGTARTNDAQLSFSGGGENLTFKLGGAYHSETTVFPGENKDERISTYLNLNHLSPNQKLNASVSLNYSVNQAKLINQDLTALALRLAPTAPALRNPDGSLNWGDDAWNAAHRNPLSHTERDYENVTNSMLANVLLSYQLGRSLQVKTNLGYSNIFADAINTTPLSYYYPPLRPTSVNGAIFSENRFRNWVLEPQASWNFKKNKINLDALLGVTFLDQVSEGESRVAEGFPVDGLLKNPRAAGAVYQGLYSFSEYRYNAIFARLNLSWDQKYILNITGRRDGSSRFGPDNRFANFGAIGAAWILTKEDFFKTRTAFVNFLKLRTTFGITGNDQLSDYQYLDTYAATRTYQGKTTLTPSRLSNPNFAWETNRKFEAAIDFILSDNKVNGTFNYYRSTSSNQLLGNPLPPTTGFSSIQNNFPAVVLNEGYEISLNCEFIQRRHFVWTSAFNLSFPKNKLVEFPGLEESGQYAQILAVGKPLRIRKSYMYEGVNPETGLYSFRDFNGDGILNQSDRQIIKTLGQEYYGGWLNKWTFKRLQIDVLIQFVKQQGLDLITSIGSPGGPDNQPTSVLKRWRYEGDRTDIQRFGLSGAPNTFYNSYLRNSDIAVTDASFVRVKNITISYLVEPEWLEKIGMKSTRLFISGQNILTFTSFSGLDPETSGLSLPPLRVFAAGIQVAF